MLGAKLKIIAGYPGGNDAVLAMERGELQGRCGWSYSSIKAAHPDWLAQKKIAILVQFALAKHPELPDVPLITDLARTEDQQKLLKFVFARQVMGRPYLAPPGLRARNRRRAAPRFHGHDGRQGISGGRRALQARDHAGVG